MVLRFLFLAILLGAAPLAAQVPTRAPTRSTIPVDSLLHPQGHQGWFGFRQDSLLILEVAPGSPAERAGIRKGDRITMIDGRTANSPLLYENPPMVGDLLRLTVRRGNEMLTFPAMVAVSPPRGTLMPTRAALVNVDTVAREARQLRGEMVLKATRATMIPQKPLIIVDGEIVAGGLRSLPADSGYRSSLRELRADSITFWRPSLREWVADSALWRPSPGIRDSLQDATFERYAELARSMEQTNALLAALSSRENAIAGAEFEQLNPGLADYFGGVGDGVFVLRVAEATPAASAGLRPGDIVQTLNDRPVLTIAALREAVTDASGTITLRVLRKAKPMTVVIRKE